MPIEDLYRAPRDEAPLPPRATEAKYHSQLGLLQLVSIGLLCCAVCGGISTLIAAWMSYLKQAPSPTQALDMGLLVAMTRTTGSATVGSALVTLATGAAFLRTAACNARALSSGSGSGAPSMRILASLCLPLGCGLALMALGPETSAASLGFVARALHIFLGLTCAASSFFTWKIFRRIHAEQEAAFASAR